MSLNGIIEIESGERIHVGENVQLRRGVSLCAMKERRHCYDTEIRIGDNVFLNERTKVWATDRITIGNNVMVGPDVLITDNTHGRNDTVTELDMPPRLREHFSTGSIIIEDNVWIAAKVCVLGVTIGRGSVVGAGSIVTHGSNDLRFPNPTLGRTAFIYGKGCVKLSPSLCWLGYCRLRGWVPDH